MGNSQAPNVNSAPAEKKQCESDSCKLEQKPKTDQKLKPCCACPETKKARDACIMEKGEENCKDLIEAHKECMRKLGFNV
ncbi:cytochrome c oxidase copper chaperone [Brachionus plicatilis]|uniref:Cytochrome c oxidase copper chaperone n=1 Tax=Brachionus plicatilis TaxID=10195 RepID=A0A3M7RCR4_BRAPC|nr:cytochrome c oxidase copper chaperone [Brachionus plicatilis]